MSQIFVGTASWADRTLVESGWYPPGVSSPEARLAHYASRFRLVEVDSTYYGLPSERNSALWVERTPPEFTFNVKAFSLLTNHPTRTASLPMRLRAFAGDAATVYRRDLPPEVVDEVFEVFRRTLMPLHSAGKLGCVLFQFPEWFVPSAANRDEVLACAARLPDYTIAVEFRRSGWMDTPEHRQRTLEWLAGNNLAYVCVDMPQGFASSIPPVLAVTRDDLAVVRFHGHNSETWRAKGLSAAERFNYLYSDEELREWAPKLRELAGGARNLHVLFNNCYRDNSVRNASAMAALLGAS